MNQMSIYECDNIIKEMELLASEESGEVDEEKLQVYIEACTKLPEKLGNLCGFMKFLEHHMAAADSEIARISAIKAKDNRRLESVKKYLTPYVVQNKKVSIGTFTLSMRKSKSVKLIDGFDNKEWCNEKITYPPDKRKIKEALEAGHKIGGAELVKKQNLQLK